MAVWLSGCPASCAKIKWPTDQNHSQTAAGYCLISFVLNQSRGKIPFFKQKQWNKSNLRENQKGKGMPEGVRGWGGCYRRKRQHPLATGQWAKEPMSQLANCEPFNCHPKRHTTWNLRLKMQLPQRPQHRHWKKRLYYKKYNTKLRTEKIIFSKNYWNILNLSIDLKIKKGF